MAIQSLASISLPLLYPPFVPDIAKNQLISTVNYSEQAGDVDQIQHYANVDERKYLEPGVAGERYKPVSSMNKALQNTLSDDKLKCLRIQIQ